jgi:hypothetical protein
MENTLILTGVIIEILPIYLPIYFQVEYVLIPGWLKIFPYLDKNLQFEIFIVLIFHLILIKFMVILCFVCVASHIYYFIK